MSFCCNLGMTLIFLLLSIQYINSEYITNCNENAGCQNTVIAPCDGSDNCSIVCNGTAACNGTIFNFPTGSYNVNFICIGDDSCHYATFNALQISGGNLIIDILHPGEDAFRNSYTICPTIGDCTIIAVSGRCCAWSVVDASKTISGDLQVGFPNVAGHWHAPKINITCPINGDCIITCKGYQACSDSTITAQPTTKLLSITAEGGNALIRGDIICPQKIGNSKNCVIKREGSSGGILSDVIIKAIESFTNVDLRVNSSNAFDADTPQPIMYCMKDYSESCYISRVTNAEFQCVDTSDPCNNWISSHPTSNPTSTPTGATQTPSAAPTQSPAHAPTQSPSVAPTRNPTVYSTSNATNNPSIQPTLMTSLGNANLFEDMSHPNDPMFIAIIIMCIILGLSFIVCLLIYFKLHQNKNSQKNEEKVPPQSPQSENVDIEVDDHNNEPKVPPLPKMNTLTPPGLVALDSEKDPVNIEMYDKGMVVDTRRDVDNVEGINHIELEKKGSALNEDMYENPDGIKEMRYITPKGEGFDNKHTPKMTKQQTGDV